jgi:hypothetical protein
MIRFYANENLSAVLVNHLRSLGHDDKYKIFILSLPLVDASDRPLRL